MSSGQGTSTPWSRVHNGLRKWWGSVRPPAARSFWMGVPLSSTRRSHLSARSAATVCVSPFAFFSPYLRPGIIHNEVTFEVRTTKRPQ